jgi:hypothetical protein
MKTRFIIGSVILLVYGFGTPKDIKIQWVEKLTGDFLFAKKQSLECETNSYEYAGISKISADRINKTNVHCYTLSNGATHSILDFTIVCDKIKNARIELNSILARNGKSRFIYPCNGGFIKIDKTLFQKGILKAEFDMKFDNPEIPKETMYWKGKIYTKIK